MISQAVSEEKALEAYSGFLQSEGRRQSRATQEKRSRLRDGGEHAQGM